MIQESFIEHDGTIWHRVSAPTARKAFEEGNAVAAFPASTDVKELNGNGVRPYTRNNNVYSWSMLLANLQGFMRPCKRFKFYVVRSKINKKKTA